MKQISGHDRVPSLPDSATCPHCDGGLLVKPSMFHWKGRYFTGLVCRECNALFDRAADSWQEYALEIGLLKEPSGSDE